MTKIYDEEVKEQDYIIDIMISITMLIRKWIKQGMIDTIFDDLGEKIDLEETNIFDWIIKPRTICKKIKKKTEVFIEVITKVYLGVLIKPNIEMLKEERLSL